MRRFLLRSSIYFLAATPLATLVQGRKAIATVVNSGLLSSFRRGVQWRRGSGSLQGVITNSISHVAR
ncbi:hypothetical protein BGY98DRAFT_997527 [Russula aff. rugulosa BPL654]|nr:hypothetical protein BGY98DRAFT_997527 [Russula aff. rugulosa BPL654]